MIHWLPLMSRDVYTILTYINEWSITPISVIWSVLVLITRMVEMLTLWTRDSKYPMRK